MIPPTTGAGAVVLADGRAAVDLARALSSHGLAVQTHAPDTDPDRLVPCREGLAVLCFCPRLPSEDAELGSSRWRGSVQESLWTAIRVYRAFLPQLAADGGGRLVTVLPSPSGLGSAAATARLALLGLAENLEHELRGAGGLVRSSLLVSPSDDVDQGPVFVSAIDEALSTPSFALGVPGADLELRDRLLRLSQ